MTLVDKTPIQPPAHTTPSQEFWAGVRDEAPLLLGVVPFGMVFGVLGLEVGLHPVAIMAMSLIVFGGASQIVFAQMIATAATGLVIVGTIGIINLRHMLYSASLTSYVEHLPWRWRILISYLLTDEAFFISLQRMQTKPHSPNMYFHMIGTGSVLWASWQASTFAGIILGELIPPSLNLGFTLPLTFIAILIPQIKSSPPLMAALTGGAVAMTGQAWPWNIWVIAAAFAGMAAGYLTELMMERKGGAA
jgi:predicted branched-subunit amino acid permease